MKKSLLALAFATVATSASADLIIDGDVKQSPEVKAEVAKVERVAHKHKKPVDKLKTKNTVKKVSLQEEISTFDHVGRKQSSEALKGFSNDVTVRQALEQLVPENWNINVDKRVNLDKKVSFAGGKTWNDTLEVVGKDNFSAVFNWNERNLVVVPTTTKHKTETIATTEEFGGVKAVKAHQVKKPVKKVVKAKKVVAQDGGAVVAKTTSGQWVLNKNLTLKQNIEAWGRKAGWTVSWKAPDYKVVANTTLTGAIDSEDGPIISILKLYQDSNLPLKVSIMGGNKVIAVESRNYVPKDVIDISNDLQ